MTKGSRVFAVRAPKLWNDLPAEIRFSKTITAFKSLLKTFFKKKEEAFISVCILFYLIYLYSIVLLYFFFL